MGLTSQGVVYYTCIYMSYMPAICLQYVCRMANQESPDLLGGFNLNDEFKAETETKKDGQDTSQDALQDPVRRRAEAFVTAFFERLPYGSFSNWSYRHTILLGEEWYTLTGVSINRKPRNTLTLRFTGLCSVVSFEGSKEIIVRRLTDLIRFGFCNDCGGQGSTDHKCKNLDIEILNPPEEKLCTICQETCNGSTRLPCSHAFHWRCITQHFDNNFIAKCPNCRKRSKRSMWDINFRIEYNVVEDDSEGETEIESPMPE